MMVYFRKRLPEAVVNDCNERIVRHGLNLIRAAETEEHDQDDSQGGGGSSVCDTEQNISSTKAIDNQGSLLIDATCAPVDIRYPTDLSLLNEAREVTEVLIDSMYQTVRESFDHKPRTYRKQARQQFLAVALAEGFCDVVKETPKNQQNSQGDQATACLSQAQPNKH